MNEPSEQILTNSPGLPGVILLALCIASPVLFLIGLVNAIQPSIEKEE